MGRLSRNHAGDYVKGIRISLTDTAGLFRELKKLGIHGIDLSDVIASCDEGTFSFSKYALKNCFYLSERDYGILRKRLLNSSSDNSIESF